MPSEVQAAVDELTFYLDKCDHREAPMPRVLDAIRVLVDANTSANPGRFCYTHGPDDVPCQCVFAPENEP